MTTRLALILAVLLVAGFVADAILWGGQAPVLAGRAVVDVIAMLAFWR